jgi:hypothetical protein
MKKLFLISLLLPAITFSLENNRLEEILKKTEKMFKDPEYLKFILGNHLDLHFYGVLTPSRAQAAVQKIHETLASQLNKEKNHFKAGKSLTAEPDAVIVNTCATIEQRLRENGEAGMISGNNRFLGDNCIALYFSSCNFNGKRFFENACPCDFYNNLSDEQLEQLKKGTQR